MLSEQVQRKACGFVTGVLVGVAIALLGRVSQTAAIASPPANLQRGDRLTVNNRTVTVPWVILSDNAGQKRVGIADLGLLSATGIELLDTNSATQQPIQWFSDPRTDPIVLAPELSNGYRYLDITPLARQAGWQVEARSGGLTIASSIPEVTAIRRGKQPWGDRLVIELAQPAPWQVTFAGSQPTPIAWKSLPPIGQTQNLQAWVVTLDARVTPATVTPQAFYLNDCCDAVGENWILHYFSQKKNRGDRPNLPQTSFLLLPAFPLLSDRGNLLTQTVDTSPNQTRITLNLPPNVGIRAWTLPNPPRLVIDTRTDPMPERNLLWAEGVRWRQQWLTLAGRRFPVRWLELDLTQPGLRLRPIWQQPETQMGIAPLTAIARTWGAYAAINGGFFNRNNQLPLGAIRSEGVWFSGAILNRGAIAWNDSKNEIYLERLDLPSTITTTTGQQFPVSHLNSGYVQAGMAAYTPAWGATYTPILDNEQILRVEREGVERESGDRIISQTSGGAAGQQAVPIPANGYLLVLRAYNKAAMALTPGTEIFWETTPLPPEFDRYNQILGAGPLLLRDRQIVLDAALEKFNSSFASGRAARSAIGKTPDGRLILATVDSFGTIAPSLEDTARLMLLLGAADALNLDGGSSSTLYLGGQLLNRSPRTAARVHNGLGIFLEQTQ